MKNLLFISLVFIGTTFNVNAQCPKGTVFGGTYDATSLTVGVRTEMFQTVWGDEYLPINNVIPGATYRIDMCEQIGSNTTDDLFLTVYEAANTNVLGFNDNFCGDDPQLDVVIPAGVTSLHAQVNIGAACGGNASNHAIHITLISVPVTCTDPDVPSITATPNAICPSGSTTLNWTGSLNDATAWHIYTGSCGGTQIGTSTTSGFAVSPSSTTTYYIRGEGGCVTPGSCGQVTVTVNSLDDASFNYGAAAHCADAVDPIPTITGLGGGTFNSTGGLSINAGTGAIDVSASTPSTYTVTYTTAGSCPNSSSVSVTVNALDDASFTYDAAAYCIDDSDPTPTITGLAGGTFSSTAGLSINAATGAVDVSASTPSTYTVTYTTAGSCPNSSSVSVTITQVDVSTTLSNSTITSNAVGATYQWLDCGNSMNIIPGEINNSYTATTNGNYAVQVIQNGCSDTSVCVTITTLGITPNSFSNEIMIYPNPTNDNFEISFNSNQKKLKINIYSSLGQLIQTRTFENSDQIQMKLNQPSGIYFVECINDNGNKYIRKLIKK